MISYADIGKRIRHKRKEMGISQEQLAEMANISVTHMSHIETGGTKLSLPVIIDIANALDCGVDEFLANTIIKCEPALYREIDGILSGCTVSQLRVITELVKTAKAALDKNDLC